MKTRISNWLVIAAGALLVAAAATLSEAAEKSSKLVAAHAAGASRPLVWPLPPSPPRIRWVQQISEFRDVTQKKKKKKGWFARVAGAADEQEREITKLRAPYGITTDSRGRIYVADYQLRHIVIYDLAGKQVELRGPTARAPFLSPIGLAVDKHDRLFVSDPAARSITCFNPEGEPLAQFGREELVRPTGLAIDKERNRLYVADVRGNRISVFDTEKFSLIQHIGKVGKEPGEFSAPTNVAVDREGNLYVSDNLNYRIQVLNRRGRFLRAFGEVGNGPGFFARPKGVAVDSEGHIYVVDGEFNNLQIFNQMGETLL